MRPFRVLGIQQVAIGGLDKQRLKTLWVDRLGLEVTGTFRFRNRRRLRLHARRIQCPPARQREHQAARDAHYRHGDAEKLQYVGTDEKRRDHDEKRIGRYLPREYGAPAAAGA